MLNRNKDDEADAFTAGDDALFGNNMVTIIAVTLTEFDAFRQTFAVFRQTFDGFRQTFDAFRQTFAVITYVIINVYIPTQFRIYFIYIYFT